jgi:hypothetical protein
MTYYATLQLARSKMNTERTAADADLAEILPYASQAIEEFCGQNFDDRIDTRYFSGLVGSGNPVLFLQFYPLLLPTTVLNGDGTAVDPSVYTSLPKSRYPIEEIRLAQNNFWVGTALAGPVHINYAKDSIAVAGHWGFHRKGLAAWRLITLTVAAPGMPDTTGTDLPLSGQAATKIDVGSILRLGAANDSEQVFVTGPVVSTSAATTLTVSRGENGTTAVTHSAGDAIYVWDVEPTIALATAMLTAAQYESKQNPSGEVMSATGFGPISTHDLPKKVTEKLKHPLHNWAYGQMRDG